MLSYTEAQNIIKSHSRSFGTEPVSIDEALGRVIAEDIFADRDYPPFNRSAMDGYAFRIEDIENGVKEFQILDVIFAGGSTEKILSARECYKIMTGAAVPLSANVVVRREDVIEDGTAVSISVDNVKPFQNIARRGEDLKKGELVLKKGVRCTAAVIGLLASVGKGEVLVEALPTIAIITTGNEVVDVGEQVNDVQIRNSNFYLLKALLKSWHIKASYYQHVQDDKNQISLALEKALTYDIVIINGGVSAGDADYIPAVLQELAVKQLFHKVAIRPGKPLWCGNRGNTMVFALPGNPLSCLVTYTLFIRHFLENCFGLTPSTLSLPIGVDRNQKVKLDEFFPVEIKNQPAQFYPVAFNGSGDIRLGLGAQAFALHACDKEVLKEGEVVTSFLI